MALAGFTEFFLAERMQIIGRNRNSYLKTLDEEIAPKQSKESFNSSRLPGIYQAVQPAKFILDESGKLSGAGNSVLDLILPISFIGSMPIWITVSARDLYPR